ncbi:MAG: glycosyl transferase family 11 [Hyphomicrobiales bacterium]|nr:glycosyl transferase family 11 [Hyphomicrobiales bacterium]
MDERAAGPVIRAELRGGLGNQLFQAAAGFALARKIGGRLQLDVSHYKPGAARGYALGDFPHGAEVVRTSRTPLQRALRRIGKALPGSVLKKPPGWRGAFIEEASYAYDPRVLAAEGDAYLRGYFQSRRYLDACAGDLRAAFDPRPGASARALDFAQELGEGSLALHVRAGDFLQDSKINAVHGTLPADYYRDALGLARASLPGLRAFVFSDNAPVARALLGDEPGVMFVEGFSAHDDLYLMSSAGAHVIANSTFSYWSAWLDPRPGAFVIAPRAWLSADQLRKQSIADLYPPGWTLL